MAFSPLSVQVSLIEPLPQHPQQVADTGRVDVGLVEISVDEVGQTKHGIEEITQRQVEDQDDGVQCQN